VKTSDIEREARTWLGTPYRHQARVKGVGVDCAGVPEMTLLALGFAPDYVPQRDYARDPNSGRMRKLLDQYLISVPKAEMQQGDIGWFAWANEPQHLGVITSRGTVIHSYGSVGKVVEVGLVGSLLRRMRRVYRVPGVEVG